MLAALNELVERRIQEAQKRGDFDALPGAGKPLELDDDNLVPEELRAAYRVLRNAGFVPPEVQALRDIDALLRAGETVIDGNVSGAAVPGTAASREAASREATAARRLLALAISLERNGAPGSSAWLEYRSACLRRLARGQAEAS